MIQIFNTQNNGLILKYSLNFANLSLDIQYILRKKDIRLYVVLCCKAFKCLQLYFVIS